MKSILGYPDRFGSAIPITVTPPFTNFANLFSTCISRKATFTSQVSNLDMDFITAQAIRVFAILDCNLAKTDQFRVIGSNSSTFASTVYDTGWFYTFDQSYSTSDIAMYPKTFVKVFPTAQTARYWRIQWNLVSSGLSVGKFRLCDEFSMGRVCSYGGSLGFFDNDIRDETLGGVLWGTRNRSIRQFSGSFEGLTTTTRNKILTLQREVGKTTPFLWIPDDTADVMTMRLDSFNAVFDTVQPLTNAYLNGHDFPVAFREFT